MKFIVVSFFLFFTTVTYSQPMTDVQMKEAAAAMCNCMEPAFNKLHPQMLIMIKKAGTKEEKDAENDLFKWMDAAAPEDQAALGESLAYLETGFSDSLDVCQKKTNKYFPKNSMGNLDKKHMDRFMKIMEEMPKCEFMLLFMKIGMKKEKE